jgi:hypothetical protein
MEFPKTTKKEDQTAWKEGLRIYGELRKRYGNESVSHLDIILNSLCFSIVRLFALHSHKIDAEASSELVKQIVSKNLKLWNDGQVDVIK